MDPDIIAATPKFRKSILAVLINTDWLLRYGPIILPEFFPSDSEQDFVIWVNTYFETYKGIPTEIALEQGLIENAPLVYDVLDVPDGELRYAADTIMEFAQVQAMKIAILESVEDIQAGNLEQPINRVKEAMSIGQDRLSLGLELIENVDDWVWDELHGRRFPTGWRDIDKLLGGGLVAGEYGLMMAPTGRGKTTALINIGFAMAGLIGQSNVLHITLEMPAAKVLKRYGARVSGMMLGRDSDESYIKKFKLRAMKKLRGKLRVVNPSGRRVDDFRRLIDNLSADGFDVEALIVDYPDLMKSSRKRQEYRFELADISRDLRQFGVEYGLPIWGATQTGRHTFYKAIITEADVSEAIEKINIADVAVAICQTREEERLGNGRLYMAKVRDARSHAQIPVKINFENQSIVQRGKLDFDTPIHT